MHMSHLDVDMGIICNIVSQWGLMGVSTCGEIVSAKSYRVSIVDLIGTLWCTLIISNILIGLILLLSVKPVCLSERPNFTGNIQSNLL